MKVDVHFSSKTNEWATPQSFFDKLNEEFNFTLDPSCTKENAKCKKFYTEEDDGLIKSWNNEVVFCNPPYGRGLKDWVKKASEAEGGVVVLLIPARTDTQYFHKYIYQQENVEIRFLKGRLKFGDSTNSAPFPSMVVIFNSMKELPKGTGNPNCEMCNGEGVVNEGCDGEYEEVPCPCTISEPADFSGSTEGDR